MDVAVAGTCRYVGMLPSEPFFGSGFGLPLVVVDHADVSSAHVHQIQSTSSTSLNLPSQHHQPASAASTSVSKKSRPMDLLRWFSTIKIRRKEKDSTPYVVADVNDNGRSYLDDELTQECIVDVDLSAMVFRPIGVEYNEWLATHTITFFEHVNIMYGCVWEFCWHSETCCCISASSTLQYQWLDERGRRTKCSAAQYVDHVMSMTQSLINDETVFPTKYGNKFPSSFESTVRKILRLLMHVLTHVYLAHCQHLVELQLHPHFNTLVYHVMLFSKQFELIDAKDSDMMEELFDRLRRHSHAMSSSRVTPTSDVTATELFDTQPQQPDDAVQNSTGNWADQLNDAGLVR